MIDANFKADAAQLLFFTGNSIIIFRLFSWKFIDIEYLYDFIILLLCCWSFIKFWTRDRERKRQEERKR